MATRRNALKIGGAALVVIAGGTAWRAVDRGVLGWKMRPAFAPWAAYDPKRPEGAIGLVKAAVLAASPHNTQPWLFRIGDDRIEILADRARNLQAFDPYRREMMIGLGAAIENMAIAASMQGLKFAIEVADATLDLNPPADLYPVASLTFGPGSDVLRDYMATSIGARHTNRGPYDSSKEVDELQTQAWTAMAAGRDIDLVLLGRAAPRPAVDALVVKATEQIINDRAMGEASESWFRDPGDEVLKHRDGLVLDAQGLSPVLEVVAKLLPRFDAKTGSSFWLEATRDVHLASAPLFGFLRVKDRFSLAQSIAAGRVFQRLALMAASEGLAVHPINQIPERMDRERELGQAPAMREALEALIGPAEGVTFCFRAGWPLRRPGLSPRRGAEDVILRPA